MAAFTSHLAEAVSRKEDLLVRNLPMLYVALFRNGDDRGQPKNCLLTPAPRYQSP